MRWIRLPRAVWLLLIFVPINLSVAAQDDTESYPPITTANVDQLVELGRMGYGSREAFARSPDGNIQAVGGSMGVWLYDLTDVNAAPRFLPASPPYVQYLAYSPDGVLLAIASAGDTADDADLISVVDAETGEIQFETQVRIDGSPGILLGFDQGYFLVVETTDGIIIWDIANATIRMELPEHRAIALSTNGIYLAGDGSYTSVVMHNTSVVVYNLRSGDATIFEPPDFCDEPHFGPPEGLQTFGFAVIDGETMLATIHRECDYVDYMSYLRFWGTESDYYSGRLLVGSGLAYFNESVTEETQTLLHQVRWQVWVSSGMPLNQLDTRQAVAINAHWLAVNTIDSAQVTLWNTHTGQQSFSLEIAQGSVQQPLIVNSQGDLLAAGNTSSITVWGLVGPNSVSAPQTLGSIQATETNIHVLGFDAQGNLLILEDNWIPQQKSTVNIWRLPPLTADGAVEITVDQLELMQTFDFDGRVFGYQLSSDAKLLVVRESPLESFGLIHVLDITSGNVITTLTEDENRPVNSVSFSPDGSQLFLRVATPDMNGADAVRAGILQAWDSRTGEFLGNVNDQTRLLTDFAFSPDQSPLIGKVLDEDRFTIWDSATGRILVELEATGIPVFGPDGTRLYFVDDGVIYVWGVPNPTDGD